MTLGAILLAAGLTMAFNVWSFHTMPASAPSSVKPVAHEVASLPLNQRIAQLLFVGVTSPSMATQLAHYHIGGYLLRPDSDLFDAGMLHSIATISGDKPLFAIDEEGGKVDRLPGNYFSIDSAAYMGTLSDKQVSAIAYQMGTRLSTVGANIDFAPVVDLDDGNNAAIAALGRSFSSRPSTVTQKAAAFADGLRRARIVPTFKHFPGLGRASGPTGGNTDTGSATTPNLDSLKNSDLIPYSKLLTPPSPAVVMVGNQIIPGLTGGKPASLSAAAYDLLRGKYGFSQVAITDELLLAKATRKTVSTPADIVITALRAGADMPLINPKNAAEVKTIIANIKAAVHDGRLSESRIDAALERVLTLKSQI